MRGRRGCGGDRVTSLIPESPQEAMTSARRRLDLLPPQPPLAGRRGQRGQLNTLRLLNTQKSNNQNEIQDQLGEGFPLHLHLSVPCCHGSTTKSRTFSRPAVLVWSSVPSVISYIDSLPLLQFTLFTIHTTRLFKIADSVFLCWFLLSYYYLLILFIYDYLIIVLLLVVLLLD